QRDAKGLREWLLDQNVPSSVIDSLLAEDTRPLFEQYDEQNFLLILRGVNLNDNADPADMLSVRILYYHGALISTRKTPSKAISTVRTALEAGQGPSNLAELIVHVIDSINKNIDLYLDQIEER
ncbi:CorA family divalent cation transporter, partial [Mycobacterium avium]